MQGNESGQVVLFLTNSHGIRGIADLTHATRLLNNRSQTTDIAALDGLGQKYVLEKIVELFELRQMSLFNTVL